MKQLNPTYIIIGLLLILFAACEQQSVVEQDEKVELTFKLATSAQLSRGAVTDYPSTPENWSQAERVVDGRYLYTVSVYIINADKNIVAAQENIVVDNQAKEVTVAFDKSYNLKRGNYTLMAVANYDNHTVGSVTYNTGLTSSWKSSDYNALMNNMINANQTDNVSPRDVIQPLSLMKKIELHAGNNVIEGELTRTVARIRIEVKNNSGALPLKIKNLTFSNNFTQKQAYVFDDGTDRKYFGQVAAPRSTSVHALLPFAADAGSDAMSIAAQRSSVIFDSYLLESSISASEKYTYTIDLEYENASTKVQTFEPNWSSYIDRVNNLSVGNESYFLIYNNNRQRYLSAGSSSVTTAQLSQSSESVSTSDVWQLISTGTNNQYHIKNVETGLYVQAPGNNSISLGASPVAFTLRTIETGKYIWNKTYYIALRSNDRYISVESNGTVKGVNNTGNGTYFRMYRVNKETTTNSGGTISYNTPITLTAIDPVTQQSSQVTAIKRNDFINVLVTVSYNPEAGTFEFYVQDWKTGGGSVDFE